MKSYNSFVWEADQCSRQVIIAIVYWLLVIHSCYSQISFSIPHDFRTVFWMLMKFESINRNPHRNLRLASEDLEERAQTGLNSALFNSQWSLYASVTWKRTAWTFILTSPYVVLWRQSCRWVNGDKIVFLGGLNIL